MSMSQPAPNSREPSGSDDRGNLPVRADNRVPVAQLPPVSTKFKLGDQLTAVQQTFLSHYGFLHFEQVATPDEVAMICSEHNRIEAEWLREGRESVYGIPLFHGRGPGGGPAIQRMPFTNVFSEYIRDFVRSSRFDPVVAFLGEDARVGYKEKDGVVINRFVNVPGSVYPRLGWHTDALRDLFYFRMPQRMLNFGLHLDRITAEDGGLRLIPGSHKQGFLSFLLRKPYFVYHRADKNEIMVDTQPGDLTIHDGRLWHRVAASQKTGAASVRRSMYLPFMTGPYEPKSENSKTPLYHRLGRWLRKWTAWRNRGR